MPRKLGLPAIIVTCALVGASIWLWWTVVINNTDFGSYNDSIRLLMVAVIALAFAMVAGCYVAYMGWSHEDLESMGNVKK
jgi:hypothetical protein